MDRRDRDNSNVRRGGPVRQGPSRGATNSQPRRQGQPRAPKLASYEDPNAYRSPGFQDQLYAPHAIDYAGLPQDDDDPDAPTPQSARQGFRNTVFQNPRGMGGRRPDRTGTDPNAYRSPGFRADSSQRRGVGAAAGAVPVVDDVVDEQTEAQSAMLSGAARARGDRASRRQRKERPRFEANCVACGVVTWVPFEPSAARPAFCKPCYEAKRAELGLGPGRRSPPAAR